MDRRAEPGREHEVVVDVRRPGEPALEDLRSAMLAQRVDCLGVERDGAPAAAGLRRSEHTARRRHELLLDRQAGAVEVERSPRQAGEFAATHTGRRR
jgi:hypothetical protein